MNIEGDMREMIGEMRAEIRALSKEVCLVRRDVANLSVQVTQHRTGWQIFMWIGAAGAAIMAGLISFWRG